MSITIQEVETAVEMLIKLTGLGGDPLATALPIIEKGLNAILDGTKGNIIGTEVLAKIVALDAQLALDDAKVDGEIAAKYPKVPK